MEISRNSGREVAHQLVWEEEEERRLGAEVGGKEMGKPHNL